jgi:hypothetical protein
VEDRRGRLGGEQADLYDSNLSGHRRGRADFGRSKFYRSGHRALPPRLIVVRIRKWKWSEGGAALCDGGRDGPNGGRHIRNAQASLMAPSMASC